MRPSCLAQPTPQAVHFANAGGAFLAQQLGKPFVAKAPAGRHGVVEVVAPVVLSLGAERHGHRHLRHDRGASSANQAAIGQEHAATGARGLDGCIHAGGPRADDQHVRLGS